MKTTIKLVGDRYGLSLIYRNCLFRGISNDRVRVSRKKKLVGLHELNGNVLGIDWYNILISVESYLKGNLAFVADDGLLRDSAAVHGTYRPGKVTPKAVQAILKSITGLKQVRTDIFIDAPLHNSEDMAKDLRRRLKLHTVSDRADAAFNRIFLVQSADIPLKSFRGIVASSDSNIIDHSEKIFDLSRYVLEKCFLFNPPCLP